MTRFTAPLSSLPDDVREYLRQVRTRGDDRSPGVYSRTSSAAAVWAFLIGPAIGLFALMYASLSTKDAWAVALLQTAGVLLGGWLFVYAFRRWLNPNHYTYFDPLHVYQVAGESATVTSLADCRAVGAVGTNAVAFNVAGRRLTVPVTGGKAPFVEGYYSAVDQLENHDNDAWRNLSPGEMGAAAKHWLEYERLPKSPDELNLEVLDVPADPRPSGKAGWAIGRYLMLFGIGGLIYFVFLMVNDPIRDDRAYTRAVAAGPGGLRGYLLDGRNKRHRTEAEGKLRALYDGAAAKIEESAVDPKAKDGLLKLVKMLLDAPQPVASIRVSMSRPEGGTSDDMMTRTDLADALATTIGKELVAFVAAPEGEPAHVELAYTSTPFAADGSASMTWEFKVRPNLAEPPIETTKRTLAIQNMTRHNTALVQSVYKELFNSTPPTIPPPPPPDTDW